MFDVKALREELQELLDEAQAIANRAEEGNRDFTEDEQNRWNALMDADTGLVPKKRAELTRVEKSLNERKELAAARHHSRLGMNPLADIGGNGSSTAPGRQHLFRCASSGRILRGLTRGERVATAQRDEFGEQQPGVGEVLRAMLTGKYDSIDHSRVQAAIGSSDTAGGVLLNPEMGAQVIDLARSASVALKAGAVTLPMDTAELNIARVTGDPTGYWRPEQVAVTSSDVTFDKVVLRPKTLAAIVPVSIELLEDSSNAAQIIEQTLQSALGLALDQAVMLGEGADSEPRGIKNQDNVNTIGSVGTPDAYDDITSAVGDIMAANYDGEAESLAWVMNPREGETYDGLVDTTGQPLMPTPWASKLRRYSTTSLPITEGGGSESSMIVGDFSQCVIGMRTSGVVLRVAQDGSVSDGTNTINATSQLMRFIVAYLRADVALMRPTWFTVLSGVTNT